MTETANISHPDYEKLLQFGKDDSNRRSENNSHVQECVACRNDIQDIKTLRQVLKSQLDKESCSGTSTHLSDELINEYVYNRLNPQSQNEVDQHLSECKHCMKQVLRLRVQIEERVYQVEANERVVPLHRKSAVHQYKLVGLSIAATVLIAGLIFLLPKNPDILDSDDLISSSGQINIDQTVVTKVANNVYQGKGIQHVNNGVVNWYGAYIETDAVGTVDVSKTVNRIQAEIIATKTARALAYAQISEILGGVQVTQQSSYQDLLLKVDHLQVASSSFIRNAQVINKTVEWIDDIPKVTVKMRVPLRGNQSIQSIVEPYVPQKSSEFWQTHYQDNTKTTSVKINYTGLALDVRDVDYNPAMHVNLKLSHNISASNNGLGQQQISIPNLKALHFPEEKSLLTAGNLGSNPYVLHAKSISKTGEIVLDVDSMDKALSILSKQASNPQLGILF